MWKEISLTTNSRSEFVNVTAEIKAEVARAGIKNGVCNIFVPHTTAGITINENTDPNVTRDLIQTLERLVPRTGDYRHSEGNSDAHLKASMVGFSCSIPIINSQLSLGTWQGIYFCEFDGPRNRKLKVGVQVG